MRRYYILLIAEGRVWGKLADLRIGERLEPVKKYSSKEKKCGLE